MQRFPFFTFEMKAHSAPFHIVIRIRMLNEMAGPIEWKNPSPALLRRAPSPRGEGYLSWGALKLRKPPSPLGRGWPAVPMHFIGKRAG